jgi:hypothetical protein
VLINDSTDDKQLIENLGNVTFRSPTHGGSCVLESPSRDKRKRKKWRRIRTIGSIGTQDCQSGPTVPMRESFETSAIRSPEHGGIYPPKSRTRDTRSHEKSERIWTVDYTGTQHRRSGPTFSRRRDFGTSVIKNIEHGSNYPPKSHNRDT